MFTNGWSVYRWPLRPGTNTGEMPDKFSIWPSISVTPRSTRSKIKKFGERSNEDTGEVSVLTAAEIQKLFQAAAPEVIPYLTLSYFAESDEPPREAGLVQRQVRRKAGHRSPGTRARTIDATGSPYPTMRLNGSDRMSVQAGLCSQSHGRPIPEVNRVRTGPIG
jgi:hypothetical protein